MNQFNPTPQQEAIFNEVANGTGNFVVDAKAGTGKTTVIVQGIRYVPHVEFLAPSVVFLAFNKSIAETLKTRCPVGTACSTFHSLGFRALKDSGIVDRKVKVDAAKCRKLLYPMLEYDDEDFRDILRLVGLLKGQVSEVSYEDIDPAELIEHHGIDFNEPERSISLALRVLRKSDEDRKTIDFDDMLHLAVKFGARFDDFDYIFVDEAQDLNMIQHEIVSRLFGSQSRMVAVGDPNQAIYGFRGAHADSMSLLTERFACKVLPLSVSFRCSKAVVREAQRYLEP